jgi:DNA invertase Pin-like site-specific DNA recombinase
VNHRAFRPSIIRGSGGDVLMLTRLDRLARSTRDLLNTLDGSAMICVRSRAASAFSLAPTARLFDTFAGESGHAPLKRGPSGQAN